jgi:hypothetical protein
MANYYVATAGGGGSNSNPGTAGSPFLTIQYGVDHLTSPGDTLYIRAGTYIPDSTYDGGGYNAVYIGSSYNGTNASNIQVTNYPGEVVIIDCSNIDEDGVHYGIHVNGANYWNITGLNVINVLDSTGVRFLIQHMVFLHMAVQEINL